MPKVFYTERDIEDLAKQGVKSIAVNDDVVVTDAAREKARRVGVDLIAERGASASKAGSSPQPAATPMPAPSPVPIPAAARPAQESTGDLETRVYNSVKARLNGQVDDALLRTIVQRVIKSLGR
jgi:hypothetical protein